MLIFATTCFNPANKILHPVVALYKNNFNNMLTNFKNNFMQQ